MLTLEVLCTIMNQNDFSQIKKMNIQSDVVFANQSQETKYEEVEFDSHTAKMITTNTRGASVNRNIAIMYSSADIIVFADDDQEFVNNYTNLIINEFENHPYADAIKFFCISTDKDNPLSYKRVPAFCKARQSRLMSAGPHALAFRREALLKAELRFAENIGPGRELYCGEDSFFYKDIFLKRIKLYESPVMISYVHHDKSTWFEGYTERYFFTVGYIYARIYGRLAVLASIRRLYNVRKELPKSLTARDVFRFMINGIKYYRG